MNSQFYSLLDSADYLIGRPRESTSVSALGNFLEINGIDFANVTPLNAAIAANWGKPLVGLSELYSHPFLTRFTRPFSGQCPLNENDFSELQALALARGLGCNSIGLVERSEDRTHDFNATWTDETIEIEVTRSGAKDTNEALSQQAADTAERIYSSTREFDVIVHMGRILNPDELKSLEAAAAEITNGEVRGDGDAWQVAGEEITRQPGCIEIVGEKHQLPHWWRRGPCMFSLHATLRGADSPTPRAKVYWALNFDGYLNSARKKAQRFQGSAELPFVIFIDVGSLPGAFSNFESGLRLCFERWKRVSAVLIFENYKTNDQFGWTFQIFKNPFANRPLEEGGGGLGDFDSKQLAISVHANENGKGGTGSV